MIAVLLIVLALFIAIDSYLWLGFRKTINPIYFKYTKWLIPFTSLLFFAGIFIIVYRSSNGLFNATKFTNFIIGIGLGMVSVKIVALLVLFLEDLFRIGIFVKDKTFLRKKETHFHARRNFVRNISLGMASLPFTGVIYALVKGKYNFHNKKLSLAFKRLPASFNGLKIVQFSDFHAGSFDDFEKVKHGLSLINDENPDIIVFTGDLINNRAQEALPYVELLKGLKAKYGKFAVLGNHDYGDYIPFNSEEEREEHANELAAIFVEAGFQLLNNENVQVSNETDTLDLIGVENWGSGRFPRYGDIEKASAGTKSERFNVLLSHDPDHWEFIIRELPRTYDLTLSGHTHGFQAGVNIPGFKWSPAQYRYKRWLGLYSEKNRYLFVSKGFGFLGFTGRIGMLPEIVTITLYSEENFTV